MHLKKPWVLAMLTLAACLERYEPPSISSALGYLVIDGFLNSTEGTVNVRLSRTASIAVGSEPAIEPGGVVNLEQVNGPSRLLVDEHSGLYTITGLTFNATAKYRLRVQTKGRIYLSDYVEIYNSPPIDSVFWKPDANRNGVQVFVASHDTGRTVGYYLWEFVETWKHDAFFISNYWVQNGSIVVRPPDKYVYTCYSTEISSRISIASTEKYSENKVRVQLTFLPKENKKISSIHGKYSILVRQRSISPTAFLFYQELQKTTENLGGLFDPQPSQVVGNMHGPANLKEPVLGYFSAGNIVEKRIFIDVTELPAYLQVVHEGCALREVNGPPTGVGSAIIVVGPPPYVADGACGDCRVDGGTTTKPSFWP